MHKIDPKNMTNTTGWMKVPASKLPTERVSGSLEVIRAARDIADKVFLAAGEELERIEALPESQRRKAGLDEAKRTMLEHGQTWLEVELKYAAALLQRGHSLEGQSPLVLVA